mmetsp:Transcript_33062/g.76174  ORF Transcript_33062/g.76174 Transcript_33062/m.76174 type:complete len:86 (-) Transcript_33062:37-294(-)
MVVIVQATLQGPQQEPTGTSGRFMRYMIIMPPDVADCVVPVCMFVLDMRSLRPAGDTLLFLMEPIRKKTVTYCTPRKHPFESERE